MMMMLNARAGPATNSMRMRRFPNEMISGLLVNIPRIGAANSQITAVAAMVKVTANVRAW